MNPTTAAALQKDLVLLGGGHSHALVLAMWARMPIAGVRLTLISPQVLTPYSGMLPGLIAGHYALEQTHIDLAKLCQYAGARFIRASACGIDHQSQKVSLVGRPAIGYDLLSINTGITPDLSVPGAAEHAIAVKPIAQLYPAWQRLIKQLEHDQASSSYHLNVVGAGAAGVELILAMSHAIRANQAITRPVQLQLIQAATGLPEQYPKALQSRIAQRFHQSGINVLSRVRVTALNANTIELSDGSSAHNDITFWCTQARAPHWLGATELSLDAQGFIAVNDALQSLDHPLIFAAGDIATQINHPRPKAGVYAVRQAPVLFENLRRTLLGQTLKNHKPQSKFLSLLSGGDQWAIACRGKLSLPGFYGNWVWRWKNRIDQKFMRMLDPVVPAQVMGSPTVLPIPSTSDAIPSANAPDSAMRCGGCGAKVGASILSRVIAGLTPVKRSGVILGLHSGDDAAAIEVPAGQALIQSVDVFKALIDDPFVLGKIAAQHALSDLFAMNASPHSAQAIVTIPYGSDAIVERDLQQLMAGSLSVLNEHSCALIGGHTSEGAELSIGFSVNGLCPQTALLKKATPIKGHKLILTQPLGGGTLFAAHAQLQAKGVWIEAAIENMLQSNQSAAQIFYRHNASAQTDITGFGLVGHLMEMLKPNSSASLLIDSVPDLSGSLECFARGIHSTLAPQNLQLKRAITNAQLWESHPKFDLLFDPQTSGGLLASVPEPEVDDCLNALKNAGYKRACVIGSIDTDINTDEPESPSCNTTNASITLA